MFCLEASPYKPAPAVHGLMALRVPPFGGGTTDQAHRITILTNRMVAIDAAGHLQQSNDCLLLKSDVAATVVQATFTLISRRLNSNEASLGARARYPLQMTAGSAVRVTRY